MLGGALCDGMLGGKLVAVLPPELVRSIIIAIGALMSAIYGGVIGPDWRILQPTGTSSGLCVARISGTARAFVTINPERRPQFEPLHEIDPPAGASVEVFHADSVVAKAFGAPGPG